MLLRFMWPVDPTVFAIPFKLPSEGVEPWVFEDRGKTDGIGGDVTLLFSYKMLDNSHEFPLRLGLVVYIILFIMRSMFFSFIHPISGGFLQPKQKPMFNVAGAKGAGHQ